MLVLKQFYEVIILHANMLSIEDKHLKRSFTVFIIFLISFFFTACPCEPDYDWEIEPINSFEVKANPLQLTKHTEYMIEVTGTLEEKYREPTIEFYLYKKIDGEFLNIPLYYTDSDNQNWTEQSSLLYHIDKDEFQNIHRKLNLLLVSKGEYEFIVWIEAIDSEKEHTKIQYYKSLTITVEE